MIVRQPILVHIGLIGKPRLWDDIIVNEILNLMLQLCTFIGTMPCSSVEKAIQICIPILREKGRDMEFDPEV